MVVVVGVDLVANVNRPLAVRCERPAAPRGGVIVSCPHSGRFYPPELLGASQLDTLSLRRSEDAFVDHLFQDTPLRGAVLLVNEFARAFVDVNRAPQELDPKLIRDLPFTDLQTSTERVKAGLGVIPRTVGDGLAIYSKLISRASAQARLDEVHSPWHDAIKTCLAQAKLTNGAVILIDCHSMPNHAAGEPAYDVILGDRFGASCAPIIMNEAYGFFKGKGLSVARNNPYAGGYTTRTHGQPALHEHALQIEINRSLYMIEGAMTLRATFASLRHLMAEFVAHLVDVSQALRK